MKRAELKSFGVIGGRYDGLGLDLPQEDGRPADAPFWLAFWGKEDREMRDGAVHAPVTCPESFTTHDDPTELKGRHSREDCLYYLCKDGLVRSAKFAAWVEERIG